MTNMKIKYFLLIFIITFGLLSAKQYDLVVCTIFRNEAPWLKEWLDYHIYNGVDKFYLYNHMSEDDYQAVLKPYIESGHVELIDWFQVEWPMAQLDAMKDAIKRVQGKAEWAAMIDVDEFIVCNRKKITRFLRQYERYAGLSMNWQLFGTSGVYDLNGGSLLKNMTWKASIWYDNPRWISNRFIKCIVKPDRINLESTDPNCWNHIFEPLKGYQIVNEDHTPQFLQCKATGVSVHKIQLNHYWFRDEKWFYDTKINRREQVGDQYDSYLIDEIVRDCNAYEDKKILRRIPN